MTRPQCATARHSLSLSPRCCDLLAGQFWERKHLGSGNIREHRGCSGLREAIETANQNSHGIVQFKRLQRNYTSNFHQTSQISKSSTNNINKDLQLWPCATVTAAWPAVLSAVELHAPELVSLAKRHAGRIAKELEFKLRCRMPFEYSENSTLDQINYLRQSYVNMLCLLSKMNAENMRKP